MADAATAESQVYSPEWCEWQYDCACWTKRNLTSEEELKRFFSFVNDASEKTRNSIQTKELDVAYSSGERTKVDIFFPEENQKSEQGPVYMFIPGGYWQFCHKDNYSYVATHLVTAGITTVIIGYDRAPKVTVYDIVEEVKQSMVYVAKRFSKSRIFISGTSAGGHLTATLLATDWTQYGLTNDIIKGAVVLNGIFDIQPLVETSRNNALHLTSDDAKRLSPMFCKRKVFPQCKVIVAVGEDESPEFHRQAEEYVQAVKDEGVECEYFDVPGMDHFTLMQNYWDPDFVLIKKVVEFMSS